VLVGLITRRYLRVLTPNDELAMRIVGLAGVALVWIVLSRETYDYFIVQIDYRPDVAEVDGDILSSENAKSRRYEREEHLRQSAQTALSVVWAAFAVTILAIGFRLPSKPLRWAALGLFGVTLGKVVLVDMERLPGFYRVIAFFVLSLMMAAAAWGYQKVSQKLLAREREEIDYGAS
jgi:hypothetical protein